jgi:uncharacterized protein (DUF1810 family)
MNDPFNLDRFVEAQAALYSQALAEIRAGRKRSHWMWFIFPQLGGLGSSPTSQRYAIKGRAEAEAYLAHPVLGVRLLECAEALLALRTGSASEVFGHPDDLKLRSSMTLFASISEPRSGFERVLDRFFGGERDALTVRLLD